ncbi:MAG: aldolase [Limimaricola sp.]|uniref:HpcH/HpaI aldolase family protein n=1 Tax=Limimaricola sp. TaxID=2211665 RepID=UPI001D4BF826|nr:aldolase/citrate lyase family protein [Limimaricola sp.]MBI1416148.1 aldolase [Limimaricola sp.]
MRTAGLKARMMAGEVLSGTFVKIPDVTVIEVLAQSGLDFLCLDTEHAGFGRDRLDACLAVARALDMPVLVRVSAGTPEAILQALDAGAVGVVVPHVYSVDKAEEVARAAHFGAGGRGYAGSTRWAGFATRPMAEVLAQDVETIVIAQIEEPEGVEAAQAIAAVPGIDALFAGPADLSVAYGHDNTGSDDLQRALARIGEAARAEGRAYATWVSSPAQAADWARHGVSVFVVASEHSWMREGAAAAARGIKALG